MSPTVGLAGAADLMKIHPNTVIDHIKSGALPAAKIGRRYVLLTKDVMALIERQVIQQTAERRRGVNLPQPSCTKPLVARRRRRALAVI